MPPCDLAAVPAAPPPSPPAAGDGRFYYFAYGSCMCPLDLERSLGEPTLPYVVGAAVLRDYRLGFRYYSPQRRCGALDILPSQGTDIYGVLYCLPWRLSHYLDQREAVDQNGYRREFVTVSTAERHYFQVRTYAVVEKTAVEIPPNDWYFDVVLRGAITCRLPEQYCWQLFNHMRYLQRGQAGAA